MMFDYTDPLSYRAYVERKIGRAMNKRELKLMARTWCYEDNEIAADLFIRWQLKIMMGAGG